MNENTMKFIIEASNAIRTGAKKFNEDNKVFDSKLSKVRAERQSIKSELYGLVEGWNK